MKKIGIISELNMESTNYGNRLQSFALNHYINSNGGKKLIAESLLFNIYDKSKITKKTKFKFLKMLKKIPRKIVKTINLRKLNLRNRINNCNNFTLKNTILSKNIYNFETLESAYYDAFIVGSDVVWAQKNCKINRIRFLDFEGQKSFKRYSYAASFGRDWIPDENKEDLKKMLTKFSKISVREGSSIQLLNSIGIKNVKHVCDPTLLLSTEEWKSYEKIPIELMKNKNQKFLFVYLLGKDKEQRMDIINFAKENNCMIVTIPYANCEYSHIDNKFGDIKVNDCSPNEWLWLINHSEYVITDSFHGLVFSTIFRKKFIVLKRNYSVDINNRMKDYLKTIDEENKFIYSKDLSNIQKYDWNYEKINKNIDKFVSKSKKYLNEIINEILGE